MIKIKQAPSVEAFESSLDHSQMLAVLGGGVTKASGLRSNILSKSWRNMGQGSMWTHGSN